MTNAEKFGFATQIRKSPYFDATERWGATGFSVYNHMYIPRDIGTEIIVQMPTAEATARVVEKPFFDPKKTISSAA